MEKEDNLNEKEFAIEQISRKNKLKKFLLIVLIFAFVLVLIFTIYTFFNYTKEKEIGLAPWITITEWFKKLFRIND